MARPKISDEPKVENVPEIQCPDFKRIYVANWSPCKECGKSIWKEFYGAEFYHAIECSKNNGIDYYNNRRSLLKAIPKREK